jgi:hypothetical protein
LIAEQEGTVEARAAAVEARTQAEESYSAAHGEAAIATEFTPSPEVEEALPRCSQTSPPGPCHG